MEKFLSFMQEKIAAIATVQGLTQVVILVVCAAGAWFFQRYISELVLKRLGKIGRASCRERV